MARLFSDFSRRGFIEGILLGMLGTIIPVNAAVLRYNARRPHVKGGVIVFQGDSITDAGRAQNDNRANVSHALGSGYAGMAAAELLGKHPGGNWTIYNRGISGHKVFQLDQRWKEDAIDLNPDVLSILIGVNDFWHSLDAGYDGTVDVYERDFRALLERTRKSLPDVKLIVGEPFAVGGGTAIDDRWDAFEAYRTAARRVADEFEAEWIPYQEIFNDALDEAPASYWAPDGVHPSPAGNYLMAQAWLDALDEVID